MDLQGLLQAAVILAPPFVLAVAVHEMAHGYVALRCGDRTAQMLGRLSLNPLRHVDPIGTVVVPGLLLISEHCPGMICP